MKPRKLTSLLALTLAALALHAAPSASAADLGEAPRRTVTVRGSYSCSEGGDLTAFGQTLPAVRTQESNAAFGADLWRTDTDQVSFHVSARRTEFRRSTNRWTGTGTPSALVIPQGLWSAPLPDDFQDVGLEVVWLHRFSSDWTLIIQSRPSYRTAGTTSLTSDGFGATSATLAIWRVTERLQFTFGAAGDTLATGSQRLLPVAGLDWSIAEQWRLSLGLPRTGLFWQAFQALELGLAADGSSNTYYVRQRGAATYPSGRPLTETKLEHLEVRVGLQANWELTPTIQLNAAVGIVGLRRFDYPDRNLVLKSDGTPAGYGSLGLTISL